MNTKLLLSVSALVMGAAGIAGLFMPEELLRWTGTDSGAIARTLVQVLAALYFAFAMVNWTARGSLIGGIYNRPVALGNLTHFVIGALTLVQAAVSGDGAVVTLAVVYAVFAVAFSVVFFRSPVAPGIVTDGDRGAALP
ncbi:MAG TPA: hypothetical protein VFV33_26000 [Gemmatimonadaceae bacterium]|nr:hypothetical protein [Gemmatimonadaceae bacterium]